MRAVHSALCVLYPEVCAGEGAKEVVAGLLQGAAGEERHQHQQVPHQGEQHQHTEHAAWHNISLVRPDDTDWAVKNFTNTIFC